VQSQCFWIFKGLKNTNETYPWVCEYLQKAALKKSGHYFPANEMNAFDFDMFNEIAVCFAKLEAEDLKRKSRTR
jgi:hypothetical protein